MAYTPIFHIEAGGTANGVTSGSADSTGSSDITINVAWYPGSGDPTVSDSKGNTWTPLTAQNSSSISKNRLYYCHNPTVGSGHTFSANGTGTYPSIQVVGFSGGAASPFDVENGATANWVSVQPGSVTPSEDNELVVTGLCHYDNSAGAVTVNGGFTAHNMPYSSGNYMGGGIAYLIQTSATAANPTWDVTSATYLATTIATFKAAAAGASFFVHPVIVHSQAVNRAAFY